jgi:hypothetical protein
MAETGDLIIKIGGDASKFKATIADVENSLKSFKANLGESGLNIKIEALGFQEAKSNIKGVADFAEGTLGAIKNTIKEVKAERLTISADPNSLAPFNIKLNELNTTVKELEKAGILKNVPQEAIVAENSIAGLNNKLKDLFKQRTIIDPDTNARAFIQINREIDKTETKLANLQRIGLKVDGPGGIGGGFKSLKKGSSEAGRAITSLALVAQDLPFGFIGIQNNLPGVQQSFEALASKSGGLRGSLKSLGSALKGPAGVFLAFSAVTSIVTLAVQEYGSLSAAIDAITGKTNPLRDTIDRLNKEYLEYNKTLKSNAEITALAASQQSGAVATAEILTQKATDLSTSEQERGRFLNELKLIDKEYYGQLSTSVSDVDKIKAATDKYTDSLLANSTVKAYQGQLDAIEAQIAPLQVLSDDLDANLVKAKELDKFNAQVIAQAAKLGGGAVGGNIGNPIKEATQAITENDKALKSLFEKRTKFYNGLKEAINNLRNLAKDDQGDGGKNVFAPKIDSQALDEFTNIDKIIARVTKYGDAFINVNNSVAERTEALKKLLEVDPKYFESFRVGSKDVDTAREAIEQLLRTLESNKLFEKQREEGAKLNQIFAKQAEDRAAAITKAEDAAVEKMFRNDTYNLKLKLNFTGFDADLEKAVGTINSSFKSLQDVYDSVFKDVIEKNKQIASSIEGYLSQPMTTFFDILTKDGETSWKDFGKVVIDTLKRIATQAITTAIAKTLANILAPGFGSISTQGLEAGFEALYGESIRGGGGQANFGGIRGNQGVNMSGQVVMTLRGADLVGAMNRTNTTISRVG